MNNILTEMIDNVIRRFGFESEKTISFCRLIEEYEKNPKGYKLREIALVYNELVR